jgi:protein-tyrosine phosphatase
MGLWPRRLSLFTTSKSTEENLPDIDHEHSVLFVCMGNICRSPTAEGVFRHLVDELGLSEQIFIDSAGTHAYHTGEPPDRRALAAAKRRGFSLDGIQARRVTDEDFERFDLVLAMDKLNHVTLMERADESHHEKIRLFLEYSRGPESDVPDPYYGGATGFERVLDLVEDASRGLLESLRAKQAT